MRSHHGLFDEILAADEDKDEDRHRDRVKAKLTLTESIVALLISLPCVTLIAICLVEHIHDVVERHHVSDAFIDLILVPLVEKIAGELDSEPSLPSLQIKHPPDSHTPAEHLTAIDEAHDNQTNFALSHVLGSSVQTALLNTPLVVLVGWGLRRHMDLNF